MKTLTIVLTDGPYINQNAEIAYRIARAALRNCRVNIFLYLDAVHIPKRGQRPVQFMNIGSLFQELASMGATIRACPRCASSRGYASENGVCQEYIEGVRITSLYDLERMIRESDRVISLSG
ncbi:MAG: DsrE family protein [Methanothrix sp.]|uniref:DsrE/DsrF/TusD sulfur relay family protein n=1 Tax=Methanothrix sp. TaxID=90426 RepID=UPI0032AFC139|nr:DsrE family protein [Methanothrix sp.]